MINYKLITFMLQVFIKKFKDNKKYNYVMNPYIERKQMIKEIEKKGGEIYFDAEFYSKNSIKQKKRHIRIN